ncbi:MAG TPA: hypothetical protein PKH53_06400, partial [Candidatus Saccharicenans sp.]|nr:hypothetical protein [Candidatus Saccharicenans sp.]
EERNATQVRTKEQSRPGNRVKTGPYFVDENGDGINDFYRDHDNDGIPNCQDPDWTAPEDGTGYQGSPQGNQGKMLANKNATRNMTASRNSFRTQTSLTNQLCDGTGPKGKTSRQGKK